MNHRIVATLVVALLAVSCTPDQPDIATRAAGKDPVEPQLRAQKPVEKISNQFEIDCLSFIEGCPIVMQTRSDQRKTEALVGQLRQDKPSWLPYIKAVEISSSYISSELDAERGPDLLVQTGIFVNEQGKEAGAGICADILEGKSLGAAFIHGVERSSSGVSQVLLARCP